MSNHLGWPLTSWNVYFTKKRKTLPEVSYNRLDMNHLTAKVCMKELSLIQPFINFKGYYDVTK